MHVNLDSLIFWRKKNRIDDYVWNLQRDTNTKLSLTKRKDRYAKITSLSSIPMFVWKTRTTESDPCLANYIHINHHIWFFQGIDLRKSYRILEELHDSNTSDQEIGHFCVYMWVLWEIVKWKLSDSCRFVAPW